MGRTTCSIDRYWYIFTLQYRTIFAYQYLGPKVHFSRQIHFKTIHTVICFTIHGDKSVSHGLYFVNVTDLCNQYGPQSSQLLGVSCIINVDMKITLSSILE